MTYQTTASLLCISATLLLLFSTPASAALTCNATNFMCYEDGNELVADADTCNCCPLGTTTNCTVAKTKCSYAFYTCPTYGTRISDEDSCQCCNPASLNCEDPQPKCPALTDERCMACTEGVCNVCIPGYWTLKGNRCSKCAVANCATCDEDDGRMCVTCQDNYKLTDDKLCEDGALGLQSSYVAAAAATLAMMLALVV